MPCDVRQFDDIEFFSHLTDDDRAALAEIVDATELPSGKTLFVAGEPGESLFVVRKGEIELFIKDTAGQKIVLYHHVAGSHQRFSMIGSTTTAFGPRRLTSFCMADKCPSRPTLVGRTAWKCNKPRCIDG